MFGRQFNPRHRYSQARGDECQTSNRDACLSGVDKTCQIMCENGDEDCKSSCILSAQHHCTSFFQDPCRLCSEQCKADRQQCQIQECLTCEDDPDGLECVECERRCFDGELECANERCRPICPDTDACKLCDEQCKIEREECQTQECLTCENDPDGLECVECQQRCFDGQFECTNERCRPICEPGELLGAGVSRSYMSNYLGPTASRAFRGNARGRHLIRNAFYPTAGRRTRF